VHLRLWGKNIEAEKQELLVADKIHLPQLKALNALMECWTTSDTGQYLSLYQRYKTDSNTVYSNDP